MEQLWLAVATRANAWWISLDIDTSPETIQKHLFLLACVWVLLCVLGLIYRGKIQNRDIVVDIISNDKRGYGPQDVIFTKGTLDIGTDKLPAILTIEAHFSYLEGERTHSERVTALRRSFLLRMRPNKSQSLSHNQFAFDQAVEKEIKNAAESRVKQRLKTRDRSLARQLRRALGRQLAPLEPALPTYVAKVKFKHNPVTLPAFLLFRHPDPEVKATGWLTLLTSLFAVLSTFLFSPSPSKPEPARQDKPIVRPLSSVR